MLPGSPAVAQPDGFSWAICPDLPPPFPPFTPVSLSEQVETLLVLGQLVAERPGCGHPVFLHHGSSVVPMPAGGASSPEPLLEIRVRAWRT